jgi:tetratricopeptide (TPR) repeat protein
VLLASLLQAQQRPQQPYPTETRPFRPEQQLPGAGDSAPPPLYKNLGKPAWNVPAQDIVRTARYIATGRLADARGDLPMALAAYREAVAAQDKLPYMEPPYWYYPDYPARQSLGVALLRAGRLDDAEDVFRASLARTPSNGWALRGLMEMYRQRGDEVSLRLARQRFESTWLGKVGMPALPTL